MTTFRNYISLCFVLFMASGITAQEMHPGRDGKTFYAGVTGAYHSALMGAGYSYWSGDASSAPTFVTQKTNPFSFGKGPGAGLYAGYMVSGRLGLECSADYVAGPQEWYTQYVYNTQPVLDTRTNKIRMSSRQFRLIPGLRFQTGERKLKIFSRAGLIISLPFNALFESTQTDNTGTISFVNQYSGRLSWGFIGTIGSSYSLNKHFSITAELTACIQNWAPYRSVTILAEQNGVDLLQGKPRSQLEQDYVDHPNPHPDPNTPSQTSKFYLPFNSIGFSLGLHYNFGKKFDKEGARYDLGT